jgi:hypothetical protein
MEDEGSNHVIEVEDTARRQMMRDGWRLVKPCCTSEEKWLAWGLLLAVIVLNLGNVYIRVRMGASREGIINPHARYNNYEGRLFMKWHGFFNFIVPPGLLLVFPELSLVRCGRADNMDNFEGKDSREE